METNEMKEKYSPRDEESPARTIDSHDSTIDSVETIVERQSQSQQPSTVDHSNAMKNSTNETNTTDNKNSLTNSQISMISGGHKDTSNKLSSISDTDAQSHIYSSPVYNAIKIDGNGDETSIDIEEQKPKLISHDEFQKQTNEEKAAKKQRIPPKLIPLKGVEKVKEAEIPQKPEAVAPPSCRFPTQVICASVQLVLSISLVALGCLLIVREASTSSVGVGIWCGIVAAVTGALGVIDIKKVRTAFMALSLVCVATSVCGLAIAGFGLLKDVNESNEAFDIMNANGKITAGCGVVFALAFHFIISILSVYQCAKRLYSRKDAKHKILESVIGGGGNSSIMSKDVVDEYIRSMSRSANKTVKNGRIIEKIPQWTNTIDKKDTHSVRSVPVKSKRQVMLIPAQSQMGLHLPPYGVPPPRGPPPMYHPSMRCMTLPSHHFNPAMFPPPPQPPASIIYPDGSVGFPSTLRGSTNSKQKRKSLGRKDPKKRQRQRRQSDENLTFTYTGLDRTIADEFLGRQEQSHHGSEISGNGRKENGTDVEL